MSLGAKLLGMAALATSLSLSAAETKAQRAEAILAAGCFWCVEADFEKLPGVLDAVSGYAGGRTENPSYKEVSRGDTGHAEVVRILYDPTQISYAELLQHFWKNVDPTTPNQQFCDRGSPYRAALFPLNAEQKAAAQDSLQAVIDSGRFEQVHVGIEQPGRFWPAEDYHQDYAQKNPVRYNYYRYRCGRDARLKALWGPSD